MRLRSLRKLVKALLQNVFIFALVVVFLTLIALRILASVGVQWHTPISCERREVRAKSQP